MHALPRQQNDMPIKSLRTDADDLRPEYDLATLKGGVRGKYYRRAATDVTVVVLEPDVARAFPTPGSVNRALRAYLRSTRARKVEAKRVQPASAGRTSKVAASRRS